MNDQKSRKIRLTIAINFISFKNFDETCTRHSKSDKTETMIGNETDAIIEELFETLLQRYQKEFEKSMKGIHFIFDSIDVLYYNLILYYNLNKISLNRGGFS